MQEPSSERQKWLPASHPAIYYRLQCKQQILVDLRVRIVVVDLVLLLGHCLTGVYEKREREREGCGGGGGGSSSLLDAVFGSIEGILPSYINLSLIVLLIPLPFPHMYNI